MSTEKRPSSLYMDLKELRNRFNEVDTEGNGYIDFDALKRMVSNMEGFDSSVSHELMKTLDRDGDGKVTFEDFQVVFTLEREAVKAEQRKEMEMSSSSPSSAAYVTALHSQASPTDNSFFSPERPPVPPGHQLYRRNLNQVLDSPDLSMHVRSIQRDMSGGSSDFNRRQSYGGTSEPGDLVLEDTGTFGTTLPSPGLSPPKTNTFMELELIEKELDIICKDGMVERQDISHLCNKLGIDAKDEQEFISLWDELQAVSNDDKITVDVMCQAIKQKETIALVTSTPANPNHKQFNPAWQKHVSMDSFDVSSKAEKINDHQSQNHQFVEELEEEGDEEIDGGDESGETSADEEEEEEKNDWIDGTKFHFNEIPHHSSGIVRPSSAKEGSRLSRGQSDSSLRHTAMMQKYFNEYQLLQQNLEQVTQERNSLKSVVVRLEDEKKQLLHDGEESVLNLQRQKEAAIRKLESEYSIKQRELETSLTQDHQTQQETMEIEIHKLKKTIQTLKTESESLKEDLKYYQTDNEKLIESADKLHDEIAHKDERIMLLQEKLGMPSDSLSESDLELHTSRIQELESNLQVYMDHNEDLRKQNTELQDQIDELKADCEKMKQKFVEERRRRQRRESDVTQPQKSTSSHGTHHHRHRHSRSSRSGRQLPQILSPIPSYQHKTAEETPPEGESEELTDTPTDTTHTEPGMTSDEESNFGVELVDDIAAQSSTSLLEEIRVSDEQKTLMTRIAELQNLSVTLEKNCHDLQSQINSLEDSKASLRNKLESELRQKMYQKTNLQLNLIRKVLGILRKAVTDNIMTSEDFLAQGLENDIIQLVAEDATSEIDLLTEEISTLKTQLDKKEMGAQEQANQITKLQGYISEQKRQLQDLQDSNGKLQHSIEQHTTHIAMLANDRVALENKCRLTESRAESQERELKRTMKESRLAIHDLTKKEEECSTQQEKVKKLESELLRLHSTNNKQTSHISQLEEHIVKLETHLNEKDSEMEKVVSLKSELQEKLNIALEALKEAHNDQLTFRSQRSSEDTTALSPRPTTPLKLLSPDQSFSSSVVGQTNILHRMKNQLEQLQTVLIEKEGEEGSEVELSFIHELLQINTSLEENINKQHRRYDSLVSNKDHKIKELESLLAATSALRVTSDIDETDEAHEFSMLQDEVAKLREDLVAKEQEKASLVSRLETKLMEAEKKEHFNNNLIQKQMEEIEKLNHYLGKARSKEVHLDTQKQKLGKHNEQLKQEILNIMQELREEKRSSLSAPELTHDASTKKMEETELLIVKESLQTAEQLITEMRDQVLKLYQHVIQPSDSKATDILEFTELITHLRECYDSLNVELLEEKEVQESLKASLLSRSHEYDSLYSEHDEEVRAVQQQRDSLILQISQMEKKFEAQVNEQMRVFEFERKEAENLKATAEKMRKSRESIETVLNSITEERDVLKTELERSHARIEDLKECRTHLINLVQTISNTGLKSLTIAL